MGRTFLSKIAASPAIDRGFLSLFLALCLVFPAFSFGQDDSEDPPTEPTSSLLPHKNADGKDEDVQNQFAAWQNQTLRKLIKASEPASPVTFHLPRSSETFSAWAKTVKDFEKKIKSSFEAQSCFWLALTQINQSIFIDSDPPFGTLSISNKDTLADLGILAKQVIGEQTTYNPSNENLERALKINSLKLSKKTLRAPKCQVIARLKLLSLGGRTDQSCESDQYQKVIDQGLELLKEKTLSENEKSLIYSYLAQAYQTQWVLGFREKNGEESDDQTDALQIHAQAKAGATKYYRLLAASSSEIKGAATYLIGRLEQKVDLRSVFTCSQDSNTDVQGSP